MSESSPPPSSAEEVMIQGHLDRITETRSKIGLLHPTHCNVDLTKNQVKVHFDTDNETEIKQFIQEVYGLDCRIESGQSSMTAILNSEEVINELKVKHNKERDIRRANYLNYHSGEVRLPNQLSYLRKKEMDKEQETRLKTAIKRLNKKEKRHNQVDTSGFSEEQMAAHQDEKRRLKQRKSQLEDNYMLFQDTQHQFSEQEKKDQQNVYGNAPQDQLEIDRERLREQLSDSNVSQETQNQQSVTNSPGSSRQTNGNQQRPTGLLLDSRQLFELRKMQLKAKSANFNSEHEINLENPFCAELSGQVLTAENASFLEGSDVKILLTDDGNAFILREDKKLGEGSFGLVCLAQEIDTGMFVAVKQLKTQNTSFKAQRGEFEIENGHLEQCNQLIGSMINEKKEELASVQPLLHGGELFEHLDRIESQDEALDIFIQCLEQGHALHERGMINRDIKPENIIWDKEARTATMIDFGLASQCETGQSVYENAMGTIPYMDPQILQAYADRSPASYSTATDVYALGVVGLDLFTDCPRVGMSGNLDREIGAMQINKQRIRGHGVPAPLSNYQMLHAENEHIIPENEKAIQLIINSMIDIDRERRMELPVAIKYLKEIKLCNEQEIAFDSTELKSTIIEVRKKSEKRKKDNGICDTMEKHRDELFKQKRRLERKLEKGIFHFRKNTKTNDLNQIDKMIEKIDRFLEQNSKENRKEGGISLKSVEEMTGSLIKDYQDQFKNNYSWKILYNRDPIKKATKAMSEDLKELSERMNPNKKQSRAGRYAIRRAR